MSATQNACYKPAMFAGHGSAKCMPSSMPFMCMAAAAAAASITILGTDVFTSVPFIAVVLFLASPCTPCSPY